MLNLAFAFLESWYSLSVIYNQVKTIHVDCCRLKSPELSIVRNFIVAAKNHPKFVEESIKYLEDPVKSQAKSHKYQNVVVEKSCSIQISGKLERSRENCERIVENLFKIVRKSW